MERQFCEISEFVQFLKLTKFPFHRRITRLYGIYTTLLMYTIKALLEDALLFNSRILERDTIQDFQNFM